MRIDINEVKKLKERLREINRFPLKDIVWVNGAEVIPIPAERIENWRFIGMNNADFIDTDFYLKGFENEQGTSWEHYYPDHNDNFGVVTDIIDDGDGSLLIRSTVIGTLDSECVIGEMPKVGDKVELGIIDGGWCLRRCNNETTEQET